MSQDQKSSRLLGVVSMVTYLIYTLVWDCGIILGCGYAVFWRGQSGFWFIPAALISMWCYQPKNWRQLWDHTDDRGNNQGAPDASL